MKDEEKAQRRVAGNGSPSGLAKIFPSHRIDWNQDQCRTGASGNRARHRLLPAHAGRGKHEGIWKK